MNPYWICYASPLGDKTFKGKKVNVIQCFWKCHIRFLSQIMYIPYHSYQTAPSPPKIKANIWFFWAQTQYTVPPHFGTEWGGCDSKKGKLYFWSKTLIFWFKIVADAKKTASSYVLPKKMHKNWDFDEKNRFLIFLENAQK